ncbi:MAG TPA: hypothetical protein VGD55_06330 [Acidothermaceae bacterium]
MSENDDISLDAPRFDRDRDGDLRDTDEEQGDEIELDDLFDLDETEAREVDADVDGDAGDEPRLD